MATITYETNVAVPAFGAIDDTTIGTWPIDSVADPADLAAHEGKAILVMATPFSAVASSSTPGPVPFGTQDGALAMTFDTYGVLVTSYIGATHGASSVPSDTPANTYIPSKLRGDLQLQYSLFSGADPTTKGESGVGDIQFEDPDGEYDTLMNLGWEGASITLYRGTPKTLFNTWTVVAKMTSGGFVMTDPDTKSLKMNPQSWLLDNAELHGERYGGTGGLDGETNLTNRLKPYLAGYCFNVSPIQINAVLLCYQVNRSSINSVIAVYDGGSPLGAGTDYASYALLAAATVAPGTYATCLISGIFRLGSTPVFGVTADVLGDNDTVNFMPGPITRGQIVRRIVTGLGLVKLDDYSQIDYSAFVDFESKQPAPVGFYWDGSQSISKSQALSEVLGGVCGWWFVRPDGRLAIGQVEDPTLYLPNRTLSYPAAGATEVRLEPPVITDTLPPRRSTFIGYRRNYTPQNASELALSLSQLEITMRGQVSQFAGGVDQFRVNNYPTSQAVTLLANFRDQADAQAEADRQMLLFSTLRRRYAVDIKMDPLADLVGRRIEIDNLNRLGWGAAKNLLACGVQVSANAVTLHLWG